MDRPLPAPSTKHITSLPHLLPGSNTLLTFRQLQAGSASSEKDAGSTGTTGTTLWLGGQVLAAYVATLRRPATASASAVELGAGVGLVGLTLAAGGYDVVLTDIEPVLSTVLAPNVAAARSLLPEGSGSVAAQNLDWEDPQELELPAAPLELVVLADTVYVPHLVPLMWDAVARVCRQAISGKSPTILLAVERRDPAMLDAAIVASREVGIELRRVAHGRVGKAVERAYGWKKGTGWEGVEVWKGRWREAGDE